jgi:cold shock CspA family protein
VLTGRVAAFDERRGVGEFVTDEGEALFLHCVSIGDGSRTIDVGARASAQRAVGHRGRDEAVAVTPLAE